MKIYRDMDLGGNAEARQHIKPELYKHKKAEPKKKRKNLPTVAACRDELFSQGLETKVLSPKLRSHMDRGAAKSAERKPRVLAQGRSIRGHKCSVELPQVFSKGLGFSSRFGLVGRWIGVLGHTVST